MLTIFQTGSNRKHVSRKTPYNHISRNTSTNFRNSISNIRITLAELISTRNHKEGVWRKKKECFDLIFERRIIHTFLCGKKKGTLKIKAKCRMFEW